MTRAERDRMAPATGSGGWRWTGRLLAGALAAAALLAAPAQAAARQIYAFGQHSNEGRLSSNEGAVRGADGTVYFVSSGRLNDGTSLSAQAPDGTFTTLHWFQQRARDLSGANIRDLLNPRGTPIIASDGNLYGVGFAGGENGLGGVYRYRLSGPNAGEYRVLYSFAYEEGCNPLAGVVEGSDGDLYGTTSACGAASNRGSVFRLSKAGALTVLKNFSTPATVADGQLPQAALVQGSDGAYYGTTSQGGTDPNGGGTVFRVTSAGSFTTLHSFAGDSGLEGGRPQGALALGNDGNLYGTTVAGGQPDPSRGRVALGTVFRITPAGSFTSLYTFLSDPGSPGFTPAVTGSTPIAGLTRGGDGNFYGVTSGGGALNSDPVGCRGSVFRVTPAGAVTTLYCFRTHFLDGIDPAATLTLGGDGLLYGTTTGGGAVPAGTTPSNPDSEAAFGSGTVFRISTAGEFTRLLTASSLPSEGRTPSGPLVQAADGLFYGVTAGVTSKGFPGSVFSLSGDGVLRTLKLINFGSNAGGSPESGLTIGPDGAFYGTSVAGGANGLGAVFRISAAGDFTTLFSFPGGANGGQPRSALTLGSDGNFYGSTEAGGDGSGAGTLFRITPGGSHTRLHSFDLATTGNVPRGRLIEASDGNFYGTTTSFGAGNNGTVFRLTPGGTVSVLHAFAGAPSEGGGPLGSVTQGADGALYGTTSGGGSSGGGTVFRLSLAGDFSTLYTFRTGTPGENPQSPLLLARDGNFYGTAANISFNDGRGVVYRITPQGQYAVVHQSASLVDEDGLEDEPIQAADGDLYVPTRGDGDGLYFGNVIAISGPADRVGSLSAAAGIGSVTLNWPVSPRALGYNVYRATTPGGQGRTPIATGITAAGLTGSYTDSGLTAGTPYYFTITAVNALGETQFSNEASATPTAPAPTVSIAANPNSLVLGAASTLSWSSTDASSCTASGSWSGGRATSGTASVTPSTTGTATYTLSCTGAGGSASASTTIAVSAPAPTVTISAAPATITLGDSTTISWTTTNAASCTASGAWTGARATTGNQPVTPAGSGSLGYTLSCTGAGGTASATATVTVNDPPLLPVPTVSLSAAPATVTLGSTSTLSWSSTDATSCTASDDWSGSRATSGSASVTPAATGTARYTLSCTGGGGSASATATVTVNPVPPALPTVTLAITPASLIIGASATLSWSSTDASACTASGAWTGTRSTSGSASVTPAATGVQTYTLACTGTGGTTSRSVTLNVGAAPGKGGGGAFGWLLLIAGSAAAGWRRRGRRRPG
ncbi:MAG: hypothetical protein C0434_02820 [Xanthomonadaceae bacterium]|nr:hypothetical protein [Xanthomonadaceae bacterium]